MSKINSLRKSQERNFPTWHLLRLPQRQAIKLFEHFGSPKKDEEGELVLDEKGNKIWQAFDVYSMDQAIQEGYIMDVAKHIYSYDTLYELNKEVDTKKEYFANYGT